MRFLADMGVPGRIVSWLRDQDHDTIHLRGEGLQRMPDRDVFGKAKVEGRVVVTFDLDFGEFAALSEGETCGTRHRIRRLPIGEDRYGIRSIPRSFDAHCLDLNRLTTNGHSEPFTRIWNEVSVSKRRGRVGGTSGPR